MAKNKAVKASKTKATPKKRVVTDLGNAKLNFGATSKVKANAALTGAVTASDAYLVKPYAKAGIPRVVFQVNTRLAEFAANKPVKLSLGSLTMPKEVKDIFGKLLPKYATDPRFTLRIKGGYNTTHFGLTKASYPNSWRGFVTYTDKELCFHAWDQHGVTIAKIDSIIESNSVSVSRRGNNWRTVNTAPSDVVNATKCCRDLLNLI